MIRFLEDVRTGVVDPRSLVSVESTKRSYNLQLSRHRDVENAHTAGVNSLDVDAVQGKYLISGSADGTIHFYDLFNYTGLPHFTSKLVYTICRRNKYAHKHSVECVQWYPFDAGIFLTSGMDKKLKVWDTSCMIPADSFAFDGKVFQHHMSSVGCGTKLIAVATSINQAILVDLVSGSHTHELRGHSSAILSCRWSPRDEHVLATASCDNKIILWDVRAAKSCLKVLDQHNGKGRSSKENSDNHTAHDGYVNGLCFTSDGLYLLSLGTDNKMRLWNTYNGKNERVNFGSISNETKKCVQFDVAKISNPRLVYVPSDGNIFVYETETGVKVSTLSGHYNCVNCCVYHPHFHELYSGGNDRNVLIWTADHSQDSAYDEYLKSQNTKNDSSDRRRIIPHRNVTVDTWSSDED